MKNILTHIKRYFCKHTAHDYKLISQNRALYIYDVYCDDCKKLLYQKISQLDYFTLKLSIEKGWDSQSINNPQKVIYPQFPSSSSL
jgi:hypothetical protein